MAYVVTTKLPCFEAGRCVGHEAYPQAGTFGLRYCDDGAESRVVVATLDEARGEALRALMDAGPSAEAWRARIAVRQLPESGGTVGPLPDGTVIEVERA